VTCALFNAFFRSAEHVVCCVFLCDVFVSCVAGRIVCCALCVVCRVLCVVWRRVFCHV